MSWLSSLVGKIPVVGGAINSVAHNVVDPAVRGAVGAIPGGSAALSLGDSLGGMIPSPGGGFLSGALGGSSGSSGMSPAQIALAAAQTANAAQLGAKANSYSDQAMKSVNDSYDARAPLRSAGINRMLTAHAPDLSALSNLRRALPVAAQAGGSTGAPPIPLGGGILSRTLQGGAQ